MSDLPNTVRPENTGDSANHISQSIDITAEENRSLIVGPPQESNTDIEEANKKATSDSFGEKSKSSNVPFL